MINLIGCLGQARDLLWVLPTDWIDSNVVYSVEPVLFLGRRIVTSETSVSAFPYEDIKDCENNSIVIV
jgi:hypothetical protein